MVLYPSFRITDRQTIERCVGDLNSLPYKALRPKVGVSGSWSLDLYEANGSRVARFGFVLPDHFWVEVPGSERFFIEPGDVPSVQRAISYAGFTRAREALEQLAMKETWNAEDRVQVSIHLTTWASHSPGGQIKPEPGTPEDLRRALAPLKEYTLRNLDTFPLSWR
jgi:hypothetical protein